MDSERVVKVPGNKIRLLWNNEGDFGESDRIHIKHFLYNMMPIRPEQPQCLALALYTLDLKKIWMPKKPLEYFSSHCRMAYAQYFFANFELTFHVPLQLIA